MPTKMQSEYMRNFKWTNRPIRFKQPVASLDVRSGVCEPRRAGLSSSTIGIHREPSIQAKRASPSPANSAEPKFHHRSSSSHSAIRNPRPGLAQSASGTSLLYRPVPPLINSARSEDAVPAGKPTWKNPLDPREAVAQDFVLLGSQKKFAPNVPYRLKKPIDPSRYSQLPPEPPTAAFVERDIQTAPVISSPPVARFFTADENIQVNENELQKETLTPPPSPPDAPRPQPLTVQTEAVQTDLDDHYAVRKRLGLVSRVNAGRYQTEYARQFKPAHSSVAPILRHSKPESPVLNAEIMFRRSRSRSPVASQMPKTLYQTEYKRSFKPYEWQLHQLPQRRSLSAEGHEILYEAQVPNKASPKKQEIIGKLKEAKTGKKYTSEYMTNFRPPSAFEYDDGTWKGKTQSHSLSKSVAENLSKVSESDPSWLAEVRELKSRAKEYQQRSKGTHFSSTHVGQLYSEKANLWDQAVETDANLVVKPIEIADVLPERDDKVDDYVQVDTLPSAVDMIPPAGLPTVRRGNVRQSLEWAIETPDSSLANTESECSSDAPQPVESHVPNQLIRQLVQADTNEAELDSHQDSGRQPSIEDSNSSEEIIPPAAGGRVRTSRLAQLQARGNGSPRRHHLDATTPSVGGALLVSPPVPADKSRKHSRTNSKHQSESQRTAVSSGYSSRARSPAAYGKPTLDTHLIVDRDRPLDFQFVPNRKSQRQVKEDNKKKMQLSPGTIEQIILERSRQGEKLLSKQSKKVHSATATQPVPKKSSQRLATSVPKISSAKTYKVDRQYVPKAVPPPAYDDDRHSSRASSASMSAASDILEKARARSNFWTKSSSARA